MAASVRAAWCGLFGALLIPFAAEAQQGPLSPARQALKDEVAASCPGLVAGMAQAFSPAELGARAVDTAAVCTCVETKMLSDARIRRWTERPPLVMNEERTQFANRVNAYFVMLQMSGLFSCVGADMEASAHASPDPTQSLFLGSLGEGVPDSPPQCSSALLNKPKRNLPSEEPPRPGVAVATYNLDGSGRAVGAQIHKSTLSKRTNDAVLSTVAELEFRPGVEAVGCTYAVEVRERALGR